jgi:hypothetical protein
MLHAAVLPASMADKPKAESALGPSPRAEVSSGEHPALEAYLPCQACRPQSLTGPGWPVGQDLL